MRTKATAQPEFKQFLTKDEFAERVEAARWCNCVHCDRRIIRAESFRGPKQKTGIFYCSLKCVSDAEIKLAPRDCRDAKNYVTIDGWDV